MYKTKSMAGGAKVKPRSKTGDAGGAKVKRRTK